MRARSTSAPASPAPGVPTLRECKIRASLLLKALRSTDRERALGAAERFRVLPRFRALAPERIVAWRDEVRRKHALAVIAAELGYDSWDALRAASEHAREGNGEIGLAALLARRARDASDGRLVLDVIGGVLAAAAALVWRPPAWPVFLSAACCFAAFGAWGIADRVLGERGERAERDEPGGRGDSNRLLRLLRIARVAAAVVGTVAALALLFSLLALALGTWIS
jgi:hypothetical protein